MKQQRNLQVPLLTVDPPDGIEHIRKLERMNIDKVFPNISSTLKCEQNRLEVVPLNAQPADIVEAQCNKIRSLRIMAVVHFILVVHVQGRAYAIHSSANETFPVANVSNPIWW